MVIAIIARRTLKLNWTQLRPGGPDDRRKFFWSISSPSQSNNISSLPLAELDDVRTFLSREADLPSLSTLLRKLLPADDANESAHEGAIAWWQNSSTGSDVTPWNTLSYVPSSIAAPRHGGRRRKLALRTTLAYRREQRGEKASNATN